MATSNSHNSTETRILWDRKGAARQLSMSVRSLDYLIVNKKLHARRKGKKVLIPHAELVRYAMSDDFEPFASAA